MVELYRAHAERNKPPESLATRSIRPHIAFLASRHLDERGDKEGEREQPVRRSVSSGMEVVIVVRGTRRRADSADG